MSKNVERYFRQRAEVFDRLYDLPPLERAVNRVFRRAIYQRFDLTFEHAGDLTERRVLDVGCGSGRYVVECARRGAREAVGVDVSPEMLELARGYAADAGVGERCRFVRSDLMTFTDDSGFDVTLVLGFFDYMEDPGAVLARLRALTRGRVLASFPAPEFPRSQIRRWRYMRDGVALRFYRAGEVRELAASAGFGRIQVLPLSGGHFLVADATSE